jgi:hypothetical protein
MESCTRMRRYASKVVDLCTRPQRLQSCSNSIAWCKETENTHITTSKYQSTGRQQAVAVGVWPSGPLSNGVGPRRARIAPKQDGLCSKNRVYGEASMHDGTSAAMHQHGTVVYYK